MPFSFQEGFRSVLQKAKKNPRLSHDANSSELSSKSTPESSASWPSAKPPKECLPVYGLVNVLGGCFLQSKTKHEDVGTVCQQVFENPSSNKPLQSVGNFLLDVTPEKSPVAIFTISELIKATDNFSPSLNIGQGGFGTVYKGKLNGSFVAIKRAKKITYESQLSAEFRNEVSNLSSVEHLNLVKLIGYAEEGPERVLVMEFVANGNLREHLDGKYGTVLDLATRLDIAIDIGHAITYLHLYADKSIIHRDIKSQNILLTENFRAKVTDFGFSRLGPSNFDASHVSTQVKGTTGYLDPEYLNSFQLTQKSDVYSYGVLLVELFTGRRPIEQKKVSKEWVTLRWAHQMFADGKGVEVLDPKLERSLSTCVAIEKVLELAFRCAAATKHERPTMKEATKVLWNIRRDFQNLLQLGISESIEQSSASSELIQSKSGAPSE